MSKQRRSPAEENILEPPKYIVSYAAMMTILLAFFIMLNTLAEVKEYGLIGSGLGLFRLSFNSLGLPGFLQGGRKPTNLNAVGGRYMIEKDEAEADQSGKPAEGRLINPDKRDLKEALLGLKKTEEKVVLPLDIPYAPRLDKKSKARLSEIARLIRQRHAEVLVCATVPEGTGHSDHPWREAAAWALRVGRYLAAEGRVGKSRVVAVGGTVGTDENGEQQIKGPTIRLVLRPLKRGLQPPRMTKDSREQIFFRKDWDTGSSKPF